jgi:hypothetical protein
MPNWKKVITSGSDASLNTLTVINGITGSLHGTASYALTASYAPNLVISGSINNVDYIDFNTGSAEPAWKSGRVFWNNTDGALSVYNAEADIALQVGQESWVKIYNASGVLVTNGSVVRLVGSHGDVPEIQLAQSTQVSGSITRDNQILGIATHDIEINSFGYITTQGLVKGINTNAFADGDKLFVSSSAGKITNIPPTAPYEIIPAGIVIKAGPGGSGIIYSDPYQPVDFSDLSSAEVGTYSNGDLWTYVPSGSTGVWRHQRQLSGSYAVTGSWSATSFTGSLLGTASYASQALLSTNVVGSANRILFNNGTNTTTTSNELTWTDGTNLLTLGSVAGTAGTISKLALYTSSFGGYGFGVSPAQLDYVTDGSHVFYKKGVTPTELLRITSTGDVNIAGILYATGSITGSLLGTASTASYVVTAQTASYVTLAQTASYVTTAQTASYVLNAVSASLVTSIANLISNNTNDYVLTSRGGDSINGEANLTFNGSVLNVLGNTIITGSLAVGTGSLGASENTITLGARDSANEGGQIGFNAPGGTWTSASFIDNWSNQIRILRGSNTTSDGLVTQWNLHTKQMQLPAYTAASSFPGTATANLAVDSGGNVITVSTSGGTVFPYTGNAVITGSLTTTGIIYAQPNGGMYFQGGDDAALYDVNVVNTIGVYGVQDSTIGSIKLGSGGGTISGRSGSIGIGTTLPTSASLTVNGNVWATSFTGSLLGTASYATQALSSSFATTASYATRALSSSFATTASYASTYAPVFPYTGSAIITGSLVVTGSTSIRQSNGTVSGSSLTIYGSGSAQPVFTVQGSQGELFSVTDSLSGSLFSVNDISGLPVLEAFSDNTVLLGSYQAPALLTTYKTVLTSSGNFTLSSLPTASYDGAFYDYTVRSGSNARAGSIMAIWSNGGTVNFTETTTTDFGSTAGLNLAVFVIGGNMVLTGSAATTAWTIKTIIRSI